jgi:hypothetical protein
VLERNLRFKLDGEIREAAAGSFVYVARGVPHCVPNCFQNIDEAPTRILVLFAPAGMEAFFERSSELPPGAVDPGVFAALGGEVGMEVLGPPSALSEPI